MAKRFTVLGAAVLLVAAAAACGDDPSRPGRTLRLTMIGRAGVTGRRTSDLWVHGRHAYTGTLQGASAPGDMLFVWDIGDPTAPALVDSVHLVAGRTNDVKVRADGRIAVVTHEQAPDGRNGITLLDLSDPAHPAVITRYTTNLERGVHNVWIEGNFVYASQNGPPGVGRLRVIDITEPAAPVEVADFADPGGFLHDVLVRDGLAFLSFWDAGLIILDVGNGIRGGRPDSPREVSRILLAGQAHNAWYWPERGYVFVGEEDFTPVPGGTGVQGILHVVDVSDLASPVEVATFRTERNVSPPHNFWLDEEREILYAAWYAEGVLALDVSGRLSGALDGQDRLLQTAFPFGSGGCGAGTCAWAPQLHRDLLFVSDIGNGLAVLRPEL